jgi:hypothetical protein
MGEREYYWGEAKYDVGCGVRALDVLEPEGCAYVVCDFRR